jgi:hypothetical protein
MFHTATVRDMINKIENFVYFFQTNVKYPNLIAEFQLYSGYVISTCGIDALYEDAKYYHEVNLASTESTEFDNMFTTLISSDRVLTASIHRNTYNKLSEEQKNKWITFLTRKKLIQTSSDLTFN